MHFYVFEATDLQSTSKYPKFYQIQDWVNCQAPRPLPISYLSLPVPYLTHTHHCAQKLKIYSVSVLKFYVATKLLAGYLTLT